MATYLAMKPPPDQAAELLDVMRAFIQADESVSPEEELIVEEVEGMVAEYLSEDAEGGASHEVLIVPQSDEQTRAVRELLPRAEVKTVRGGRVFSVGRFFSPRYAERICDQYIALGLFTASVEVP